MLPLANGPQWELNVVDPSEGEDIHFCFCFFLFFFFPAEILGLNTGPARKFCRVDANQFYDYL